MDQKARKLMAMHRTLHPRDDIDNMRQEKEEEEDSPALKIALTHQYENFRTPSKRPK